ncbi:MAG: hypothetical protein NTV97_17200 [Alphaproteobacteria bacterium]|nr:hypothetical protein [Alphaproteobacteria bacterium]
MSGRMHPVTAFVLTLLLVGVMGAIGGYEPAPRHSSTFQSERLGR